MNGMTTKSCFLRTVISLRLLWRHTTLKMLFWSVGFLATHPLSVVPGLEERRVLQEPINVRCGVRVYRMPTERFWAARVDERVQKRRWRFVSPNDLTTRQTTRESRNKQRGHGQTLQGIKARTTIAIPSQTHICKSASLGPGEQYYVCE